MNPGSSNRVLSPKGECLQKQRYSSENKGSCTRRRTIANSPIWVREPDTVPATGQTTGKVSATTLTGDAPIQVG